MERPVRICNLLKTASEWTSSNPVLLKGELGGESDTGKFKFGDGTTAWASLAYAVDLSAYLLKSLLAGGTQGQILVKKSAADLDFEWQPVQVADFTPQSIKIVTVGSTTVYPPNGASKMSAMIIAGGEDGYTWSSGSSDYAVTGRGGKVSTLYNFPVTSYDQFEVIVGNRSPRNSDNTSSISKSGDIIASATSYNDDTSGTSNPFDSSDTTKYGRRGDTVNPSSNEYGAGGYAKGYQGDDVGYGIKGAVFIYFT